MRARAEQITLWQWALIALVAGYTSYFTRVTLEVHHGLGTSAYDYGLYDQGIWLMSRFESPFVTLMGRNLMGDHTSFILVFLVPVFWAFPSAGALFFAQSLAIAMFPTPFAAELYGPDDSLTGRRLPAADRVDYVLLPSAMDAKMKF